MAFKQVGSLMPFGAPVYRRELITNSITTVQLDSLKMTSGFLALGTTAALVFGHLVGHVDSDGVGVLSTGTAGAAFGTYLTSYLTSSNNQTVTKVRGLVDVSNYTLYTASLNAAIGTTTGSNLSNFKINLADQANLSESSTLATTLQYNTWGVDQANAAQAIVNIYQSSVFGV